MLRPSFRTCCSVAATVSLVAACSNDPRNARGTGQARQPVSSGAQPPTAAFSNVVEVHAGADPGANAEEDGPGTCSGVLLTYGLLLTANHCGVGSVKDGATTTRPLPETGFLLTRPLPDGGASRRIRLTLSNGRSPLDGPNGEPNPTRIPEDSNVDFRLYDVVLEWSGPSPAATRELYYTNITPEFPGDLASGAQLSGTHHFEVAGYGMNSQYAFDTEYGVHYGLLRWRDMGQSTMELLPHFSHKTTAGENDQGVLLGDSGGPLYVHSSEYSMYLPDAPPLTQVGVLSSIQWEREPVTNRMNVRERRWANLMDLDNHRWLIDNATDPHRPNRWIGQTDYMGACRLDADTDCDRQFEPVGACPNLFDTGAGGNFVPPNLGRGREVAAYGGRALFINDRARVVHPGSSEPSSAATGGYARIGVDSVLKELTIDGSHVQFTHRYQIEEIHAAPATVIERQDGRDLESITTRDAKVPELVVTTTFPSQKFAPISLEPGQFFPPENADPNQNWVLTPGSYVSVATLKNGSRLRLGAGKYFFDELILTSGGILEIDHTDGHTEIYVREWLDYQSGAEMESLGGSPQDTLVVYFGAVAPILSSFIGTLVAPRGSINLASLPHYGAFYAAGGLELHQGGAINYMPMTCYAEATPLPTPEGAPNDADGDGAAEPGPPSDLRASVNVNSSWTGNYCAQLNITNQASTAISST